MDVRKVKQMEDILKYHRIQGKLKDVLVDDKICSASIENNSIAIGTEEGWLHLYQFTGQPIKSFKDHNKPVNDISMDSHGMVVATCSDNGSVVIHSLGGTEEDKTVINLNEPIKAVCVENDNSPKKDRSFIIGGESGKLIHHKTVWFTQKNLVLFNGAGSAVSSIAWRGDMVAWSDATQVRVMNIATQSAVCYVGCPQGGVV